MDVALLPANDLDRNGSTPMLQAIPSPSETELRARGLRAGGVPSSRGPSGTTLAVLATLAGAGALALGSWAFVTEVRSDGRAGTREDRSLAATERAVALLSNPATQRLPLAGSEGRIVVAVGADGRAVLVLDRVEPAPAEQSYQAWLIGPTGKVTGSAGVFTGAETVVPVTRIVSPGSGIGVTLEPNGTRAPTRRITLVAQRS